ncbi:interferon alpha/beta receptor 1b-like [Neosynchiropus ocellatus]
MWTELCWTLLMTAVCGSAEPAPPQNLTMVTLNTDYELHWDWNQPATDHVTFTVQYLSSYKLERDEVRDDWSCPSSCANTTRRFCDLTHQDLYYRGSYNIRVRACVKGVPSNWSAIKFCPDKDARLGPPSRVELSPAGADLEVVIRDPLTSSNGTMREMCPSLRYLVLFWKHKGDRQKSLQSAHNRVVLPGLQPQTRYCVAVQSVDESYYNKSSAFTTAQCVWTGGAPPWWQIILYSLVSLLGCFLVVLLIPLIVFRCYRTVKSTCYPSVPLPDALRQVLHGPLFFSVRVPTDPPSSPPPRLQLLCDSPGADRPRLIIASGLSCDQKSVCSELVIQDLPDPAAAVETAPPSGVRRDSGCQQGSGDSGVYSLDEGASSQRLSDCSGSSVGPWCSWQDQVKPKSTAEASWTRADQGAVGVPV